MQLNAPDMAEPLTAEWVGENGGSSDVYRALWRPAIEPAPPWALKALRP